MATTTVIDDRSKSRYELLVDGAVAGFADYELGTDRITVLHVEVDHQLEGHGLGRELVDGLLADARRRALLVLPRCPFARRVIAENQDAYLDLVPADAREKFGLPK
jgi:predicted GNAT family acetyltransferase